MLKITGLDGLQKQLNEAQKAFRALDGQFATIGFDPENPESVTSPILFWVWRTAQQPGATP
jgi:hypothetical protein